MMPTAPSEKTCRLVTFGCKVNQYESQLVKETLLQNGFREAEEGEAADLCIVNTCTVTGEADSKARQQVRQLARQNPQARTIVMGCYATREPETVALLPNVVEVVPDKRELPDLFSRLGISEIPAGISYFDGHRRAFVKVQDGCILKCTYCIIPQVRPGLRSRTPEEIDDEVRRLVDNGYREIVLSGIHLGHYGVDTTRGKSGKAPFRLGHLIQKLDKIPGNWKLRLSSIEAAEVGTDFIDMICETEHLCPHFHPSLQSGSNEILLKMRRRYRIGRFLEKMEQFRSRLDNPAFSTDVIVGFPGETEQHFQETLDACEAAGFMKIHIFPFSARKGTPAASYPDQILGDVKQERCRRLSELEQRLARNYYETLKGKRISVLIENRPSEIRSGWLKGTACRYAPVDLPPSDPEGLLKYGPGDRVELLVTEVTAAGVTGRVIAGN